jgi:Flp pilus assembly protein TadG
MSPFEKAKTMKLLPALHRFRGHLCGRFYGRFSANIRGIAAAEFAMIAPLMITMYFGVTEISDGYTAGAKVTAVASSAADLTAQKSSICDSDMNDIFSAVTQIITPYPVSNLSIVISSIVDAGNGTTKVAWSNEQNGTARAVNAVVTLPTGLVVSGSGGSVILAEVTYNYSSPTGHLIYGSVPLSDKFYLHPRRVAQIPRVSTPCTSP